MEYINGAGFINTSRATITTGNLNIIDGDIKSFDTRNGEITVDGSGINLSNVNKAEFYANSIKLNAKIYAQDLDIVSGKNNISIDGTITKLQDTNNDKPQFSIDAMYIGGIYANNININSGKDINIIASDMNSGNNINLKAVDNVTIASQHEYYENEELHEKSNFNLAGVGRAFGIGDESLITKNSKSKNKISSKSVASNLNAGNNIN